MKAIEIKTDLKNVFLASAKACGLEVEELKKCKFPGRSFYCITNSNISMNDIFQLGVHFAQVLCIIRNETDPHTNAQNSQAETFF